MRYAARSKRCCTPVRQNYGCSQCSLADTPGGSTWPSNAQRISRIPRDALDTGASNGVTFWATAARMPGPHCPHGDQTGLRVGTQLLKWLSEGRGAAGFSRPEGWRSSWYLRAGSREQLKRR